MKHFNYLHTLTCFVLFVFLCLTSPSSFSQTSTHKKGDKIEVKMSIDGKEAWVEGIIESIESNGSYKVQLVSNPIFSSNSVRKISTPQANNSKPATGGGQTGGAKPAGNGTQTNNSKPAGQAANAPVTYKAKDKVEVEILYKGKKIWVEGTYNQKFKEKHLAQYKHAFGSGNSFFEDKQIRPFTGNITNLNAGAGTGGGNSNTNNNAAGGNTGKTNPYTKGEKVEVCLEDCGDATKAVWVEATYDRYVNVSNMKGHLAAWNTGMGSGTKAFEDSSIRKSTGKLKGGNLTADVADAATIKLSKLENEIIAEINLMRKAPLSYANNLQKILDREKDYYIKSVGDNYNFKTSGEKPNRYSGAEKAIHQKDIEDLIALLKQRAATQKADPSKMKQLKKNDLLTQAAKTFSGEFTCDAAAKLVKCQAKFPKDASKAKSMANNSHIDCDCNGPMERANAIKYVGNGINECLFPCGKQTAKGTVLGFLIDYGVSNKGHRLNLTHKNTTEIGVGSSYDAKTGCIRTVIKCGYN
ncbi:MAG: hypothetical protein ACPGVB_04355 [Chitinophagales bacterium]